VNVGGSSPGYPDSAHYDLETVLLHELGHFEDPNALHSTGCEPGPMWEDLDTGEWWRDVNDWHRNLCPSPRRADSHTGHRARARFQVIGHRLRPIIQRTRR
jgi:hypothetical protein